MEAYDHYSSEGTPWGLSFPSHWQRSKLGRITSKIGSGATPKGGKTVYLDSGKVALIRSLNVHDEGFRYEDLAFIDDEAAAQLNSVSVLDNDVLLNITGASILRTTLAPRDVLPARVNQHVSILRPTDDVNPGYLHAWLASPQMHRYMYSQSVGSTREAITKAQLQGFPIMLPLKPEQDAIVAFLDAKTAEIDVVVEKLRRQRELLERYKRELIAHTVTKGLNPESPMKDSEYEFIGTYPADWQNRPLFDICDQVKLDNSELQTNVALQFKNGSIIAKPDWDDSPQSLDILSGYTLVSPGMIVINGLNLNYDFKTKRIGLVKNSGAITSAYIVISPHRDIESRYLNYLFKSIDAQKALHGMTEGVRKILNWKDIRRLTLPMPNSSQQIAIANYLDTKTAEIDSLIANIDRQVELLGRYRKQVINDVVTGKIRVSEEA